MAPKTKSASANGTIKKTKSSTPPADGTASPTVSSTEVQATEASYGSGKPEKALYDAEQHKIKADMDALQVKLNAVKEKISLTSKSGPGNDRKATLRAELDGLRGQQSTSKTARSKIIDQLKTLQEGIQKKVKDLNAAKGKTPYKTVAEVDERIRQLDKQVESGNLKLVEEKRALQEISQCRRSRRAVEGFQAEQEAIEADRAIADELRKQLDDPEAKAISERYDAIRAELDEIKKVGDEAYANRSKLLDERSAIQLQLDELWSKKKESAQRFREANDRYWQKVHEDRARRAERARAQRQEEEEAKKKDAAERLREEAEIPAFQVEIEDCQTLIDYFSGKSSVTSALSTRSLSEQAELSGVPKLELRKVEGGPGEGMVARKKKGEDDESYFVGGKGRKGRKSGVKPATPAESNGADAVGSQLNVPLPRFPLSSNYQYLRRPPPPMSRGEGRGQYQASFREVGAQDRDTCAIDRDRTSERWWGAIHRANIPPSPVDLSPTAAPGGDAVEKVESVQEVEAVYSILTTRTLHSIFIMVSVPPDPTSRTKCIRRKKAKHTEGADRRTEVNVSIKLDTRILISDSSGCTRDMISTPGAVLFDLSYSVVDQSRGEMIMPLPYRLNSLTDFLPFWKPCVNGSGVAAVGYCSACGLLYTPLSSDLLKGVLFLIDVLDIIYIDVRICRSLHYRSDDKDCRLPIHPNEIKWHANNSTHISRLPYSLALVRNMCRTPRCASRGRILFSEEE
ncbi:hypothetical protein A0H81_04062 [Grifola frondosa]|uniref:Nuclear segregation protein BFR1 n=1 Tax=Grifola frondosa TaxID=5627 RepID=A0A1C7MNR0_GRIFR|nr:hypothetical protein A0H81_04062 [Grifola frondosa]